MIRAVQDETNLLVVDTQTDQHFSELGVTISGQMEGIETIRCPDERPLTTQTTATTNTDNGIVLAFHHRLMAHHTVTKQILPLLLFS